MQITDFISRKAIVPELKSRDKKTVITELVKIVRNAYSLVKLPTNEVINQILTREKLGSTGIGRGIAIPHTKTPHIKQLVGAFGRSKDGIDFNAIDGERAHLFFIILSPQDAQDNYHKALKCIMDATKTSNFLDFLKNAGSTKEIEDILREVDQALKP